MTGWKRQLVLKGLSHSSILTLKLSSLTLEHRKRMGVGGADSISLTPITSSHYHPDTIKNSHGRSRAGRKISSYWSLTRDH